jgi:hypothetical protein
MQTTLARQLRLMLPWRATPAAKEVERSRAVHALKIVSTLLAALQGRQQERNAKRGPDSAAVL